ncbi:MAG: DUF2934 domain-containing protein [Archangium sp.]|nr:DUF2934 domain-containing protein [Archangium sp.]
MTTKPKAEKNGVAKTKRAVAAKAKLTTGAKRAVKRVRVQMVKPTPSAPTHVVATERAGNDAPSIDMKEMEALVVPAPLPSIARHELELMIRREAFKRAQARHFRGGSPAQDWFAAEAAVKAELHSKGVQLPN